MKQIEKEEYIDVIKAALREDLGDAGDISTICLNLNGRRAIADIVSKENGVICGLGIAADVFRELDPAANVNIFVSDGDVVHPGSQLMEVEGKADALLTAERTALNFIQRLSGISSYAYRASRQVLGTKTKVADTRKTTPGLRMLEKYAVRCGGGFNHRIGLFDAVLLKDNHIALAGGVREAVLRAREKFGPDAFVEVETSNMDEVREAVEAGATRIMLDNMDFNQMAEAVAYIAGRAEIEVSGNVDLLTLGHIADLGVDIVSMGALTHSVYALDVAMYFKPE